MTTDPPPRRTPSRDGRPGHPDPLHPGPAGRGVPGRAQRAADLGAQEAASRSRRPGCDQPGSHHRGRARAGTGRPTRTDLIWATASSQAALDDPHATLETRLAVLEAEAATYTAAAHLGVDGATAEEYAAELAALDRAALAMETPDTTSLAEWTGGRLTGSTARPVRRAPDRCWPALRPPRSLRPRAPNGPSDDH